MHTRRLVKRSILGSRVYAPSPTGDGAPVTGVVQAVKQENRDSLSSSGTATNCTTNCTTTTTTTGQRRNVYTVLMQDGSLKEFSEEEHNSNNGYGKGPRGEAGGPEEQRLAEGKRLGRPLDPDARCVSLLEQKRKVVSWSEEEADMDKVTAAMVLTSLSTSPLVRSPPVKVSEGLSGSWKDTGSSGPFTPSSYSSSGGYWSWSAPSDQSNPSTPSPPLSAESFKPFRMPSTGNGGGGPVGPEDPSLDDQDGSSLLFDEPIPRKRKNSMKVMFKCLWKNCGKVLSTAAGIQRHIRTVHLGRNCDSDWSDGEEDFYYTEINFSISWQSPPVTFTGKSVSPSKSQSFSEQRSQTIAVLSSPPRATGALSRKMRGEGKKCRKVYGMENRDMWCTACRWKKACQRFTD
ncbi:hypothetical protein NHX12_023290 [Muraenolepis orangiensis]|uniref:C2H2-type domain-containing protein n=1 Tax=Muraenolepis orangiensis TaxID=630683 RepID=A0A9Q0EJS0_9TELE|nr:hypothetical protein NHX12_023290 [Muraenolepis orangiensis]